jgi:hypothetical protein
MAALGRVLVEALVLHYGRDEVLRRLAHPFWFQSLGCVMGMDWHSSGITTSVLGALKRGLAPVADELGLYVCGGRGRHSRKTPDELRALGDRTGCDGEALARTSKLVAKVDSAAVQDGYQLYLHGFILAADGKWTIVQQGMRPESQTARRYHWLSEGVRSFVDEPHAAIAGPAHGELINLTDHRAARSQAAQLALVAAGPDVMLRELLRLPLADAPQSSQSQSQLSQPQLSQPQLSQLQFSQSQLSQPQFSQPQLSQSQLSQSQLSQPQFSQPQFSQSQFSQSQLSQSQLSQSQLSPPQFSQPQFSQPQLSQSQLSQSQLSQSQLSRALRPPPPPALPHLSLPSHHDVRPSDVLLRRLHGTLAAAAARAPHDFAELLLTPGLGARTVAALALVAEVLHGAPCRFTDPARFSLAHGGKDGHPFPVPLRVYDETLRVMQQAIAAARLGNDERLAALRRLDAEARRLEAHANGPSFAEFVAEERARSADLGGRTVQSDRRKTRPSGDSQRSTPERPSQPRQLELFVRTG